MYNSSSKDHSVLRYTIDRTSTYFILCIHIGPSFNQKSRHFERIFMCSEMKRGLPTLIIKGIQYVDCHSKGNQTVVSIHTLKLVRWEYCRIEIRFQGFKRNSMYVDRNLLKKITCQLLKYQLLCRSKEWLCSAHCYVRPYAEECGWPNKAHENKKTSSSVKNKVYRVNFFTRGSHLFI